MTRVLSTVTEVDSRARPAAFLYPISLLDAGRALTLRATGKVGRRFLIDRSARVTLYGSVGVLLALVLTTTAPLWLLGIGPIAFGVPHLLADVRYLVARQGLHRRVGFWLLVGPPLLFTFVYPHATTGFVAVIGAAVLARGSRLRRLGVLAPVILLVLLAARAGHSADVLMAHLHNIIAVSLWWAWSGTRKGPRWIPLALFAISAVLLLGGVFDASSTRGHAVRALPGVTFGEMLETLSPVENLVWGRRLVLFFAFAQAVHYAIWLRLVPEEDRPRPGLRSFESSFRALQADVGWVLPLACAFATVALATWACIDAHVARLTYLQVALFHGPLEIAVACLLFIEARPLKPSGNCAVRARCA